VSRIDANKQPAIREYAFYSLPQRRQPGEQPLGRPSLTGHKKPSEQAEALTARLLDKDSIINHLEAGMLQGEARHLLASKVLTLGQIQRLYNASSLIGTYMAEGGQLLALIKLQQDAVSSGGASFKQLAKLVDRSEEALAKVGHLWPRAERKSISNWINDARANGLRVPKRIFNTLVQRDNALIERVKQTLLAFEQNPSQSNRNAVLKVREEVMHYVTDEQAIQEPFAYQTMSNQDYLRNKLIAAIDQWVNPGWHDMPDPRNGKPNTIIMAELSSGNRLQTTLRYRDIYLDPARGHRREYAALGLLETRRENKRWRRVAADPGREFLLTDAMNTGQAVDMAWRALLSGTLSLTDTTRP